MVVSWFSAGITSAVATKLALRDYDNVEIYYIDIATQHQDNARFIHQCEQWYGQEIKVITNSKGYKDQFDVIRKTGYVNGAYGARCTLELKKKVRQELEKELLPSAQVFGFDYSQSEINRAIRFKQQYDVNPIFPLIDNQLNKEECHGILQGVGIEPPMMYRLGFPNNNCIGCVKGGRGYWNAIRKHFGEHYDRMAELEREVGRTCLKDDESNPIYLDELPENSGRELKPIVPNCGMFCQVEFTDIIDDKVELVMNGDLAICDV